MTSKALSFDVAVVGAGGAGLAAACAAAEAGCRVLLLEKLPELRGTTSWSVGSIAAAGTQLQRRAGIVDRAEDFAEDIEIAHAQPSGTAHLRNLLAHESAGAVEWLQRIGVVFVGPFPEPPNRVPRMHNAVPAGRIYVRVMEAEAKRLGVDLRVGASVTDLVHSDGAVRGLRFRQAGEQFTVQARSVVLAAGDYSGSDQMRAAYLGPYAAKALPVNPHSQGDGHRLAQQVGAGLEAMDRAFGPQLRFVPAPNTPWIQRIPHWRWLHRLGAAFLTHAPRVLLEKVVKQLLVSHMSPSDVLVKEGAVLVDTGGELVAGNGSTAEELALRSCATGYVIGNAAIAARFCAYPYFISTAPGVAYAYFQDYERGRPDLVHWAADANALAARLGMDAERLNRATAGMQGRLFSLGPCQAMLTVAEGGARIDARCRVLTGAGEVIPGLYAAGGNGQGGLLLKGHGLHIGWAITSGRVAGRCAATQGA